MAWEPDTEAQAAPVGGEWRAWAPGAHTPPEERQRSRSPSRGGRGPLFSFAAGPQHSGGSSGKRVPLPRPGAAACFPGPELASCSLIVTLSEIVPPGDSSDLCEVSSSAVVIGALRAFRGWGARPAGVSQRHTAKNAPCPVLRCWALPGTLVGRQPNSTPYGAVRGTPPDRASSVCGQCPRHISRRGRERGRSHRKHGVACGQGTQHPVQAVREGRSRMPEALRGHSRGRRLSGGDRPDSGLGRPAGVIVKTIWGTGVKINQQNTNISSTGLRKRDLST